MAGICFFFEPYDIDVWSGRRIDLDAWNYACNAAGDIDHVVVINRTRQKIRSPNADIKFDLVESSKTNIALDDVPDFKGNVAYICCPWDRAKNKTSLWDFDHNVDWYVFGPANGWREELENGVYIPQNGIGAMHSTHIATTILLHRYQAQGVK
jgi:hypothetical protein